MLLESRICECCGESYGPSHKLSRFCSISCSSSRKRKEPIFKTCAACDREYEVKHEGSSFCSSKCFVEAEMNVTKFNSAREYCSKSGMTFEVWTQDRLGEVSGR